MLAAVLALALGLYSMWFFSPYRFPPLTRAVLARDLEAVRSAIQRGADLEQRTTVFGADNYTGFTPLLWAADRRDVELIQILIDAGADVHALDGFLRRNALNIVMSGDSRRPAAPCIEALVAAGVRPDVRPPSYNGSSPMSQAIQRDDAESLDALLAGSSLLGKGQSIDGELLLDAILYGDASVMEMLIRHGADVHAKTPQGEVAIDFARKRQGLCKELLEILERAASR
jgi:ankyrin repeat protein